MSSLFKLAILHFPFSPLIGKVTLMALKSLTLVILPLNFLVGYIDIDALDFIPFMAVVETIFVWKLFLCGNCFGRRGEINKNAVFVL